MLDHRKLHLSVLTPVLAGFLLVGSPFAFSRKHKPRTAATQTTNSAASSKKATSKRKSKKSAAAEATTAAPQANAAPSAATQHAAAPGRSERKAASTRTAVSSSEIASAKSKGLVWVNTDSKVYHKDGRYYGNTRQGRFMTEADAQKAGYKAAKK